VLAKVKQGGWRHFSETPAALQTIPKPWIATACARTAFAGVRQQRSIDSQVQIGRAPGAAATRVKTKTHGQHPVSFAETPFYQQIARPTSQGAE